MGKMMEGRVIRVDQAARTMDVYLEYGGQPVYGVRMREGLETPDYDSLVMLAGTDEGQGDWVCLSTLDEATSTPRDLAPGDKGLATSMGNKIVARRNGTIEIESSATAGMYLFPLESMLRMNLVKHKIVSPHGSMIWEPAIYSITLGREIGASETINMTLGNGGNTFGTSTWATSRDVSSVLSIGEAYRTEVSADGGVSIVMKDLGVQVAELSNVELKGNSDVKTKNVAIDAEENAWTIAAGTLEITLSVSGKISGPLFEFDVDQLILTENDGYVIDGLKLLQGLSAGPIVDMSTGMASPLLLKALLDALNFKVRV